MVAFSYTLSKLKFEYGQKHEIEVHKPWVDESNDSV